ncbi:MAG: response regulator [Telmatospirillum sp.]|nr:response regulator [Telmatospirillum sp.]
MRKPSPTAKPASRSPPKAKRAAPAPPLDPQDIRVVAIGASAGGLEACLKFVATIAVDPQTAFVLVQHLDPAHESMMVGLLAGHAQIPVREAADDMPVQGGAFYVMPPGVYLSVANGRFRLGAPPARHGARLPFDFLLNSLAAEFGDRAVGIVMSGSGADGSLGIVAIKSQGGLTIAQEPNEAAYGEMPRAAIATGRIDLVLPVAKIAAALTAPRPTTAVQTSLDAQALASVLEVLRATTQHDFAGYKTGTLVRRIERRLAMAGFAVHEIERYLAKLRDDPQERVALVQDVLINVTRFFRDATIFKELERTVVADLVAACAVDEPLRIWIAGCSSGEETYSIAILFQEAIERAQSGARLCIFASDVDPVEIARARDGVYPASIKGDVTPERLARFFVKEGDGYRIGSDIRAHVVFSVQNLLVDPPFSRLDFVSCRNLLIYLKPAAQAKILSVFAFALRKGGYLLLGSSETIGDGEGAFKTVSKAARIFRRAGARRPSDLAAMLALPAGSHAVALDAPSIASSRQERLAQLCQAAILADCAPGAALVDANFSVLYTLGPAERYLRVPPGPPTHDLLDMVGEVARLKVRAAVLNARREGTRVLVKAVASPAAAAKSFFDVSAQPLRFEDEDLVLVCFHDIAAPAAATPASARSRVPAHVAQLERELSETRRELDTAVRTLETTAENEKVVHEEALSANEELQSSNEELLTSKEELQSLNEELIALNSQLQETLERQRTTSSDLQNVLYSTDVATVFLDTQRRIRFFTPASRQLFNILPTDVGRPLADLNAMFADADIAAGVDAVLAGGTIGDREIEAKGGQWFQRRVLPYMTHEGAVGGVLLTFTNVTERKRIAVALETARAEAEAANIAKSRFLAAASHDLRQPLQTLALLQGLLAKSVTEEKPRELVSRIDETLTAMSGMLNTLLDINQIEAGIVRPEAAPFVIDTLLVRLHDEFSYVTHAQGLELRVVGCREFVLSDARLLEQMLRNLLANAIKYTKRGKILIGCRRKGGSLRIEVRDTGIGIAGADLSAIFEEYHQIGNVARQRNRGLGLGLSIVKRLGGMLHHRILVHSVVGKGSAFSVEVPLASAAAAASSPNARPIAPRVGAVRPGTVLVVEDDEDLRNLLDRLLVQDGHRTLVAADGAEALAVLSHAPPDMLPDLVLADYNLPNGIDGLQVAAKVRAAVKRDIPVVILTGDITTAALRDISRRDLVRLNKPVKSVELLALVGRLLPTPSVAQDLPAPAAAPVAGQSATVCVVDDDDALREVLRLALEAKGFKVQDFASGAEFFAAYRTGVADCLLVDAYMPGMDGMDVLAKLRGDGDGIPAIMITGSSDVAMAVSAMKAGAFDFIEKPIGNDDLFACLARAIAVSKDANQRMAWQAAAARQLAGLTPRQREIMEMVLAGHPSKNIAADLHISQRTVENHRASIMRKSGVRSLPALARLALAAAAAA